MTHNDQQKLGRILWNIADDLRGSMNADDSHDYMLVFLFLRYLSDNYEAAATPAALRTRKRGLMQQLFSSHPEETA